MDGTIHYYCRSYAGAEPAKVWTAKAAFSPEDAASVNSHLFKEGLPRWAALELVNKWNVETETQKRKGVYWIDPATCVNCGKLCEQWYCVCENCDTTVCSKECMDTHRNRCQPDPEEEWHT